MKLNAEVETDVLVMGAGLAGIMAAITAAEAGASVCITSSTKICSGSSFYPGTWGFGMIGPENREDEQDLIDTIVSVGEQMADLELVKTLVSHISESIEYLEKTGLQLKQAENRGEKEFIPCFDHKNRHWNGIIQGDAKAVLLKRLHELGIRLMPDTEILQLVKTEEGVRGAVALNQEGPVFLSAGSVVIASGGMGGIFEYRLNTSDITGMGQYLALEAGAKLVNLEFFQMMPGYIRPAPKTIYNEKVFCYSLFQDSETGFSVFRGLDEEQVKEALEKHSFHGPYTTRLSSRIIDERIFQSFLENRNGVKVTYREEIWENQPEFVKTYFDWLWEQKVLTVRDPIWIGIFAHASNGGIMINSRAETGVEGLYACGEATGGMHGADRLGGLSTVNGLVFGRIAGAEAAVHGKNRERLVETEAKLVVVPEAKNYLEKIQSVNTAAAMIQRDRKRAEDGLVTLDEIEKLAAESFYEMSEQAELCKKIRETSHLFAALVLTRGLLSAILLREESRGAHNRLDFPEKNPDMCHMIVNIREEGVLKTTFDITH